MHANDPVNRIMTEPVLTIGPEDSVRDMLQLFITYPVHHLPVVKERRVIGMLSSADLMKLEFFLPPPGAARDALLNDRFKVERIMRTPVVTVSEHETVQRAAELMARNGFHSLPVVNRDDYLIGIVTTTDLMGACLRGQRSSTQSSTEHFSNVDAKLSESIARARHAVECNDDPLGIAGALLQLQRRVSALESVARQAKRYVNAGQDEHLHAALGKAIEQLDRLGGESAILGLDQES